MFDPAEPVAVAQADASRSVGGGMRSTPRTRGINSADLSLLPRLPDTAGEILSIAKAVGADPRRDVYLRRNANEATVKALSASGELATYRTLAFATHGLVAGDLNGLTQPALALTSPLAAKVEGDGLLDMEEILGLKLDADWTVLSACNTAAADGAGAEAVSGLGRAFFFAGSRALLVSNWPVHSAATRYLMTDLFKRYARAAGLTRAEALRRATLATIDDGRYEHDGQILFSYAHPLFWGPFSLVGDGAGSRK